MSEHSLLTLDQMVGQEVTKPRALSDEKHLQHLVRLRDEEGAAKLLGRVKAASAEEASAYFLHAMLLAVETLAQGNKLVAGRAFDDALTHFLADLRAELGDGFAANAAALLIRNIALFLPEQKRDMVLAALDAGGR